MPEPKMTYELVYSPESLEDLDRIWSEVWEVSRDPDTADEYIKGLRGSVRKKRDYPKSGIPVSYMGEFTGIYMVSFKAYIAFYRIHGNVIEIGRFLYAKSDYLRILYGKSEFIPEDRDDHDT